MSPEDIRSHLFRETLPVIEQAIAEAVAADRAQTARMLASAAVAGSWEDVRSITRALTGGTE